MSDKPDDHDDTSSPDADASTVDAGAGGDDIPMPDFEALAAEAEAHGIEGTTTEDIDAEIILDDPEDDDDG